MAFILPEVAVQKLIQNGIYNLRQNIDVLDEIFAQYKDDEMINDYGQSYIDDIKTWFSQTKIPVVQAWTLNMQKLPSISVHLTSDTEDEGKAGISDYFGDEEDGTINVAVFNTLVDIGIHSNREGDSVLWLYYILRYILFKEKRLAEKLGLQLHTYSAGDWNKVEQTMAENVWTRWIRFKCISQNAFIMEDFTEINDMEIGVDLSTDSSEVVVNIDE